ARLGSRIGGPLRHQALEDAEGLSKRIGNRVFRIATSSQRVLDGDTGDQRLLGIEIVHMRSDFFDLLDVARYITLRQHTPLDMAPYGVQTPAQAGGVAPILLCG